jgi:PIN domain nuclease of toxin-antitoxin system
MRRRPDSKNICDKMPSLWELAIKSGLRKLQLKTPFEQFIETNVTGNGMSILQASIQHFATVQQLPQYHRDPFDRPIIAQSIADQIPIMTIDPQFNKYGIELIP